MPCRLAWVCLSLVVSAGLVTRAAQAPNPRCEPMDEGLRRPDFFSFRAQLQSAVARHDADAVLAVVDPRIRNNFGGDDGVEAFARIWRIREPDSQLWGTLGAVLALGGVFEQNESFVAPYTFKCGDDAFQDAAVIGAGVVLRSAPSRDAPARGSLTFGTVRLVSGLADAEWTEVQVKGGGRGFVASRYLRSPVGYRAYFIRARGQWRMTVLVAGD